MGQVVCAHLPVSAEQVHQVVVDVARQAHFCSCPFRPRPCLHSQALALLHAQAGKAAFDEVPDLPEWAVALLNGRALAASAAQPDRAEAKMAARQQRYLERLERAAHGLEDLDLWLQDVMRQGLAQVISDDPGAVRHIAARMGDASLPGLSRHLRLLSLLSPNRPDWAERVLEGLALCALAVRAFRQRHTLPDALLADLQTFVGISARREEVLATGERVQDQWLVLALREENLERNDQMRRTWMLGLQSGRFALLLDYNFGGQGFPPAFRAGTVEGGTVVFYPATLPLRVVWEGGGSQGDVLAASVCQVRLSPLMRSLAPLRSGPLPLLLQQAIPVYQEERFWVQGPEGEVYPIAALGNVGWQLLALSGGHPIVLFGEWDGAVLLPLGVEAEVRWVTL